jgi:hypothetical protein
MALVATARGTISLPTRSAEPSLSFDGRTGPPNHVRYVFLDDRSRRFFDEWGAVAHDTARILRIEAGRDPHNARPRELLTTSDDFRTFCARHDVRLPASGRHHFHHPEIGALDLIFEATSLGADPDLTLLLATAQPNSTTEAALGQLARTHSPPART